MMSYRVLHCTHINVINQCYPNKFNLKKSKTQTEQAVKLFMKHDPLYVKNKTKQKYPQNKDASQELCTYVFR